MEPCPQRRRLLGAMAGGAALLALPAGADAAMLQAKNKRILTFVHTHTEEQLSVIYRIGDSYIPGAMARVAHLLRDFRTGDMHVIDPRLLDVLWQTQHNLKTNKPFEIISGYRSPKTNAQLRGRSAHSGVAKDSMHLYGKAIDIHLPGVPLADVRDAALELKKGGVGYYPDSGFVHIDTGKVRHW